MSVTYNGYELCRALSLAVERELKLLISDSETYCSENGTWARVRGRTTDGRYLSVRISIESNTPTASESGGQDKG